MEKILGSSILPALEVNILLLQVSLANDRTWELPGQWELAFGTLLAGCPYRFRRLEHNLETACRALAEIAKAPPAAGDEKRIVELSQADVDDASQSAAEAHRVMEEVCAGPGETNDLPAQLVMYSLCKVLAETALSAFRSESLLDGVVRESTATNYDAQSCRLSLDRFH